MPNTYNNVQVKIAPQCVTSAFDPGLTFGTLGLGGNLALPGLPGANFNFGVSGQGLVDAQSKFYSQIINGIVQYDLTAILDPVAQALSMARVKGILVVNFNQADGDILTLGGATILPGAAPGATAGGTGGTVPVGTYLVSYTFVNANGETTRSADATVVVTSGQQITVTLPALPTGATGINVYMSTAGGSSSTETKQNGGTPVTTTTYTIASLTAGATFPTTNTAFYGGLVGPFGTAKGTLDVGPGFTAGSVVAPMVQPLFTGLANGWPVTSPNKIIQVNTNGRSIQYGLVLWGNQT